ncbi:hypothetical protein [Streptomyces thermolilacinus]|uniref:hypothetical protein n=1 Tax=Streptomyces thermolilacinus TaxID=285540 RepID=UPI0034033D61
MCIRVRRTTSTSYTLYDDIERLITIPAALPRVAAYTVVRAILDELAAPQPAFGARCFCGDPVRLGLHIPQQRETEKMVMNRGA